jgi:hypothetical protein
MPEKDLVRAENWAREPVFQSVDRCNRAQAATTEEYRVGIIRDVRSDSFVDLSGFDARLARGEPNGSRRVDDLISLLPKIVGA